MPWSIKKKGNKWVVYNEDTGHIKGIHKTKKGARQQQKALYANVPESWRKNRK